MSVAVLDHEAREDRDWVAEAVRRLSADAGRTADTDLVELAVPALPGIGIYLKDETSHPTGSLKHRLARSLFLYGLCNGRIRDGSTIVEASSGSTAVSEAYFARLLGLPFIAVVPRSTAAAKIRLIERHGGECRFVERAADAGAEAERIAAMTGGVFMDQFTYAERAVDWRDERNIAASIFRQMDGAAGGPPAWIVSGAGTGGTLATIGRHVRYRGIPTRICLADPKRSVFHRHHADRSTRDYVGPASAIEGIGRPHVQGSFLPQLIDRAIAVPDEESIAAARVLSRRLGRRCGGSTGTAFHCLALLATEMIASGRTGSLVTLICDSGDRYADTLFDDGWLAAQGLEVARHEDRLEAFLETGALPPAA